MKLSYFLLISSVFYQALCGDLKAERTRQLLLNIRSHLAKQVEEVVQQKECDSGLTLCEAAKDKVEDVNEPDDEPPPIKPVRGHHKPDMKVNPKDIIQNMIHKVPKTHVKKRENEEYVEEEREKVVILKKKEKFMEIVKKESDESQDKPVLIKPNVEKKAEVVKKVVEPKKKEPIKKEKKPKKNEEGIHFPDFPIFPGPNFKTENDLCRKHCRVYVKQLQKYKLWALMMYDASAKLPSGILEGNVNQLGHYDECLAVNAVFKSRRDEEGIKGKYCLVTADIQATVDEGALKRAVDKAEAYGFIRSSLEDDGHFIPRFTTINWAICVPHTCNAEDVEKNLASSLSVYNESSGIAFDVKVDEEACISHDDVSFQFHIETFFGLLCYIIFGTLAGYATYKDLKEDVQLKSEQGKLPRIIRAFSLKRNWDELTSRRNDEAIECIHGIKALFTITLFIAHKTIPLALTPFVNRVAFTQVTNEISSVILRNSIIYTDSFLMVSGVLTAFNMARQLESRSLNWYKRIISRYIRLTPCLLAILVFYATISHHVNHGPMWEPVVGKNANLCQKYFWRNLLYIQNLFPFEEMCAPQTHQLALDIQLSLTAPLFVYLLHNYGILGFLIMQTVFLVSATLRYISTINNELTLVFYHGVSVSQLYRTANLLYGQALYRATPYLMGLTVGYYLQTNSHFLKEKLSKPLIAIGWMVSLCLGLLSITSSAHLASRNYVYDVQEAAQYAAMSPISWSLAIAWTILACHLGFGGRFNEFLASRPFVIISRISYAIYLVQFLVFNYNIGVLRTSQTFSISNSLSISELTTVVTGAILLTLIFDLPMREVKKILTEDKKENINNDGDGDGDGDDNDDDDDDDDDKEHLLKRSPRMQFDADEDDEEKGEEKISEQEEDEEEELENFWNQDED